MTKYIIVLTLYTCVCMCSKKIFFSFYDKKHTIHHNLRRHIVYSCINETKWSRNITSPCSWLLLRENIYLLKVWISLISFMLLSYYLSLFLSSLSISLFTNFWKASELTNRLPVYTLYVLFFYLFTWQGL